MLDERAIGGAGVVGDSPTGMASFGALCRVKTSRGTRRRGDEAVFKTSRGSSSWHPVKGIDCRPKEKCSKGSESSWARRVATIKMPVREGDPLKRTKFIGISCEMWSR